MANPTILKNMLTTIKNLQAMLLQQSEANNSLFEALIETKKLQTIEGSEGDAFAKTIKTHPWHFPTKKYKGQKCAKLDSPNGCLLWNISHCRRCKSIFFLRILKFWANGS